MVASWVRRAAVVALRLAQIRIVIIAGSLLVKLEHIGLVNILAGEEVVEEFIQADAEPVAVSRALERFLTDERHRKFIQTGLADTAAKLGGPGAHERAAQVVDHWLRHT